MFRGRVVIIMLAFYFCVQFGTSRAFGAERSSVFFCMLTRSVSKTSFRTGQVVCVKRVTFSTLEKGDWKTDVIGQIMLVVEPHM